MKFTNSLKSFAGKTKFTLKKHSSEIYLVSGLVLGAATVVLASVATMKTKPEIEKLAKRRESIMTSDCAEGTSQKKLVAKEYGKTAIQVAKHYAPAVATGCAAVACILVSHRIIRQRYVAATAAYATLEGVFGNYRKNVIEQYGEQTDIDMYYGIKHETVKETVKDADGKKKTISKDVSTADAEAIANGTYAVLWDELNSNCWCKDPIKNLNFLKSQQDAANYVLKHDGVLFLNDLLIMLGYDKKSLPKAGQFVGWTYKPEDPQRDCQVMFSIFNPRYSHLPEVQAFLTGKEMNTWIDFNVEGDTWKMLA